MRKEIAPLLFGPKTLRERPELADEATRRINGFAREGVAQAALAVVIRRKSVLVKLGTVHVPTLVMCGRDDRATVPAHSEAIASHIKGARLVWIEESGHMSAIEQPEAVNATLVPFVREQLRA
jgi:pimeloyl-ACP methyl ester carboxylesterase